MKICSKCCSEKLLIHFNKCKNSKDGLSRLCRSCSVEIHRISNIKNSDQRLIYNNSQKGKYLKYKADAKKRSLSFDLTFDDFISFWQKPCFYCGSKIETIGLDRHINDFGYSLSNIVSCCTECNFFKRSLDGDEFLCLIKKISSYLF